MQAFWYEQSDFEIKLLNNNTLDNNTNAVVSNKKLLCTMLRHKWTNENRFKTVISDENHVIGLFQFPATTHVISKQRDWCI